MQNKSNAVVVEVDATEVKQSLKKVRQLVKLLEEANSLVDELASKNISLKIDI